METVLRFIGDNAEIIIALCALIVSIYSIRLGYITLKEQQKHNRLSVKPIGKISFITSKAQIRIEIRNDGIGPMLCNNFKVYDNKSGIEKENLNEAINILKNSGFGVSVYLGTQFTIFPGEQKTILIITGEKENQAFLEYREKVLQQIKKISLEFEYSDIYNQPIAKIRRSHWDT